MDTVRLLSLVFLVPEDRKAFPNVPVDLAKPSVGYARVNFGIVISPPLNFWIKKFHHILQ